MQIRYFRQADFKNGLLECLNALSPTDFADHPWAVCRFTSLRAAAGVRTFVATETVGGEQVVVGTYSVFVEPKFLRGGTFVGHVEDVAVHPDWQGKGVGKALVEHAVAFCAAAGCYKTILDCDQTVAPFYEKLGFRRVGEAMRLDINPNEVQD